MLRSPRLPPRQAFFVPVTPPHLAIELDPPLAPFLPAEPMPLLPFLEHFPRVGARAWLAPSAVVTGDVELGEDVSFWFHTVARGDVHWIRIGDRSNIQDGAVLHVSAGTHPLSIGREVVIGHGAIVHGCTLEDRALVGIGARVLDGAVVREGAQVAAGAVVPPGMEVPACQLVMGTPARVRRALSGEELAANAEIVDRYVALKEHYRARLGSGLDLSEAADRPDGADPPPA